MRYTIWYDDDYFEFTDGRRYDMDVEAIKFESELSLSYQYNHSVPPSGKVTDVRLEDGSLTGEVEFFPNSSMDDEKMKEYGLRLGGYYTDIVFNDDKTHILSCRLRSVSMLIGTNTPGWPKNRP